MSTYIIGVDIGQSVDNTAIAVLKHKPFYKEIESRPGTRMMQAEQVRVLHNYDLVSLEKVELGTPYPKVVDRLAQYWNNPKMIGDVEMVVDVTGIGRAIYDYLCEEQKIFPIGVNMTGGLSSHYDDTTGLWSVPKKDMVAALVLLYQSGRIGMHPNLSGLSSFVTQVSGFSAKLKKDTGHMTYEAMSEQVHDDLVIAVALAGWWAQVTVGNTAQILKTAKKDRTYDPKRFRLNSRKSS